MSQHNKLLIFLLYNFYSINNCCLLCLIIRFITNNFLYNLSKQLLDLSSGKIGKKREFYTYIFIIKKKI